jgi:hypothetical protein
MATSSQIPGQDALGPAAPGRGGRKTQTHAQKASSITSSRALLLSEPAACDISK